MEINTRVRALEYLIQQKAVPGIVESVPSFRSLLVYYDPALLPYAKATGDYARLKRR